MLFNDVMRPFPSGRFLLVLYTRILNETELPFPVSGTRFNGTDLM
jgi:hypothetical protein